MPFKLLFSALLSYFCLTPWVFFNTQMVMAQNQLIPVNVGVVLDFSTGIGKMGLSCIQMALSDFYEANQNYKTRLVLHTRDSKQDVVGAASAVLDLIKNGKVQAILGPESSMQAEFIIQVGDKAQVPIISFSATSPSLTSINSPYFIRAIQNDSSQVRAISAIIQAFGWREAVLIYVDNEYGEGAIPFLTDALQNINTHVPYRSVISPSATGEQIVQELYKLMTMQTRVFIVHMVPSLGSRLFLKARELGMISEGYVWIITDGLGNLLSVVNSSAIDSMQGVLGIKTYIPDTKKLEEFTVRWKRKFQQEYPTTINAKLNIFGLRAYDAALALAMAVEKIGATNFGFQKLNISGNSTDLEISEVSQIGPKLCQALSSTTIEGLAGDFHVVDGQLQASAFQIVNVIGNGGRGIGFWTLENGISRELNFTNSKGYNTSKDNLGVVIWPGEPKSVPKGWDIPTNGKKLRIGVPVLSFPEFVNVRWDNSTNIPDVTGYSIDVFKAVIKRLPYAVTYDFIPFAKPDRESAGTYDDLVLQVYLQKYDAVVGDVTIRANRSFFVDFTLPYTESGVSMVSPIKDNKRKSAWVFLKPLTWDLWVTSGCFFVFIGFVIWLLEHRINEDFRGPPSHQVGMIFWFSFSTMVFAHKERVLSNLARFVVIVWVFVVLILTQSYTASLTSMLTVEKLQPTVTDVNELIKRGENVGYLDGSFIFGLLKNMGFDKNKLKAYSSQEECDELFSKGSANGGIAAAFDETPYTRLFLAKYCSKYTMVGPTYKANGFGFIFPSGSPLVRDVSRAVLTVTESKEMEEIEEAWLGQHTSCADPSTSYYSNNLGLDSFWGLFLIAAVASSLAIIIFTAMFLYEHWHVLTHLEVAKLSPWKKFKVMLRHLDQKDLSSHTFRKSGMNGMDAVERSAHGNYSPSPFARDNYSPSSPLAHGNYSLPSPLAHSNYSPPSPSCLSNYTEQGRPSTDHGNPSLNRQTPQEMVSAIELTNPTEERSPTPGTAHGKY